MNNQIQDAITAEEAAIAANVVSIVSGNDYGQVTATSIADAIIKKCNGSNGLSTVEGLALVSCLADAFKQAKDALANSMVEEAAGWPKNSLTAYGVTLKRKEVGVSFNYSEDAEWSRLNAELTGKKADFNEANKELTSQIKGAEARIKAAGSVSRMATDSVIVKLL